MPASEEAETAIRQRIGRIVEALEAKSLGDLKDCYTEDVVSFDIEPPLQHVGVDAKLRNWANAFTIFRELRYELRDLAVTADGEVAFAHGFGRLSGTLANGTATDGMWVRATYCLKRTGGEWRVAHDQVSVPFDIATGRGVADLEP